MLAVPPVTSVRLVTNERELEAVFRLRYEVYVEEMGRDVAVADHSRRLLYDRLDQESPRIFAAFAGERPVATVRANYLRESDVGPYESYYLLGELTSDQRLVSSVTTRLMVDCDYRLGTVTSAVCRQIYRHLVADGIEFDFVDCDPRHLRFFSALGYKVHRPSFVHEVYGEGVVAKLDALDADHLERVRSPFRRDLRAFPRASRSPQASHHG